MKIIDTRLSGLKIIVPKKFGDTRGFFLEAYQTQRYAEVGMVKPLCQLNFSRSQYGVLRGLHYQLEKPQAKLITILRGKVFDVALDIRRGSPTFGQWEGFELSEENGHQIYIPEGFAHGFVVLSEEADFCYACTDYYDPTTERGITWADPQLAIPWGIDAPILSPKDEKYFPLNAVPDADLPLFHP